MVECVATTKYRQCSHFVLVWCEWRVFLGKYNVALTVFFSSWIMSMLQISQEAISKYSCSVMVWHFHDYIINHTNYLNPKGLTFYGPIFKGFACFRWVWSQMKPGVKIWLQCKRPWNVAWCEVKSREPRRMNGLSCSGEYVIYICWQLWWVLQILNLLSCSIWPWTACTSKPIYYMSALHESCISLYKLFFCGLYMNSREAAVSVFFLNVARKHHGVTPKTRR